ncbi:hypothetical protein RhiLY_05848 [Ceratobasidium sp. AG-Ba]|nr:hypothetical protein RhiLY_05848 [Ceratobasidium sp. AG-Ba]
MAAGRTGDAWLRRYDCDPTAGTFDTSAYIVVLLNTKRGWAPPRLWFVQKPDGLTSRIDDPRITSVPYLTSALQLFHGIHTTTDLSLNRRRFIVSSGLQDAITGSQPKYINVDYFVAGTISNPINSTSPVKCPPQTTDHLYIVACGSVKVADSDAPLPAITKQQIDSKVIGSHCSVVEDYRQNGAFDVLGSIGGLLALLQGIHIFLFGRPLFWGMFGAKLLTPFGLVGRFATRGFKQRLRDHYTSVPASHPTDLPAGHRLGNAVADIQITKFLFDYVLDMGPATVFEGYQPLNDGTGSLELPREMLTGRAIQSQGQHDSLAPV